MSRNRAPGFTLVELLIGMAVLMLLMVVASGFMLTLLHGFSRGSTRSGLQQQCTVTLARMSADLQSSAATCVTLLNPLGTDASVPVALALIPIDTTQPPDGAVSWQMAVIVYAWDRASGRLVRRVFTPDDALGASAEMDPLTPHKVTPELLTTMASTAVAGEQVLAHDVTAFQIHHENDGGSFLRPPLVLQIRAERHGSHQDDNERFDLLRAVAMRNKAIQP